MEIILLKAVSCRRCDRTFYICWSCWRGQAYCCEACRRNSQREAHRLAQQRYRQTAKGREAHRQAERRRRIRCRYGLDSEDPNWILSVKTNPINLTFVPEDQEPASMVVTAPTHSTSFSGWLGLWGIPGDPKNELGVNRLGHDISDYKFYSLKKGTRIKFSAVWESYTASTDAQSYEMRVRFELYRNGQTYFVTDFDLIENSGDETREITLLEDGVYRITAVDVSYIGTNSDPKEYRAYTMDVILNGESVPGELILTFQSAEWVKQYTQPLKAPYNLVTKFQVENTYDESRIVRNHASLFAPVFFAPVLREVLDRTETAPRAELLAYFATAITAVDCGDSSDTSFEEFCPHNRLGEDYLHDDQEEGHNCLYDVVSPGFSTYYSIPPHSKTNQTILIPATLAEYRNFDESLQVILLGIQDQAIHPGTTGNDGCHFHGLYYRPVRAPVPSINLLLNSD